MTEHESSRTLVKSPPELWAECSEAESLARHLGEFGEITITRLDPETAVAWEGEHASGTVRIEPSGWGTRVTLTAQVEAEANLEPEPAALEAPEPVEEPGSEVVEEPGLAPAAVQEPDPVVEEKPEPVSAPTLLARAGFFARMRQRLKPQQVAIAEPDLGPAPEPEPALEPVVEAEPEPETVAVAEPEPEPTSEPEPVTEPAIDAPEILVAALESLGQAHHRPFSRG